MKEIAKIIFLAVAMSNIGSTLWASTTEEINLNAYLSASLKYHVSQEKYLANVEPERLNLKRGKRYFWPELSVSSAFDEATKEVDGSLLSSASHSIVSGFTTGLDASWTSLIGTNVSIELEHQYGHQLGKTAQGIPEDDMQAHNLSFEISQPLLKRSSPKYNRSEYQKAVLQWRKFQHEGDTNRLTLLRDALQDYLAMQENFDRLQILKSKLNHTKSLVKSTEVLVNEGLSLPIDAELAILDYRRQKQVIDKARHRFTRSQQKLTLQWTRSEGTPIMVQKDMSSLLDLFSPVLYAGASLTTHPEYAQTSIESELANIEEYVSKLDHWPDLKAYYRIDRKYREQLPDEEHQAWGFELSYSLTNLPTKQQQALRRADAKISHWNKVENLQELKWQASVHLQNAQSLFAESEIHSYGVDLTQKALSQELIRYEEGRSSYRDVQQRQQDLLDRELAALTNETELAGELINLAYYVQWDWLDHLPDSLN